MYYLGVDLGGTNIASAVVTREGELLGRASIPTGLPDSAEHIAERIAESCRQAVAATGCSMEDIDSIGIGAPGIADIETGTVIYSCNLDFYDTPLTSLVEDLLHRPVLLENDANAAALGEYIAGSGRGCDSLVAVTLGTGVGGGIVIRDQLLTGFNYAGAEIGHFVMVEDGEPCGCGRKGCFEAYCSATALIRQTRNAMEANPESLMWQVARALDQVDGRTVFDAMLLGDQAATAVFETYVKHLACGLASMINIFQPEVLCIGGGICNQGETLLAPVRALVEQEDYARNARRRTKILRATLGNDAGIIGAALLPLYR